MYSFAATLLVLVGVGGACLLWYGWRDRRDPLRPVQIHKRRTLSRNTKMLLVAGGLVGMLAWIVTGWFLLLPAGIGIAALVPRLASRRGAETVIARMEALEEWQRRLVGLVRVGIGLEQAIIETRKTLPRELEPELQLLISRLSTNHPTRAALLEFADSLDDATGDLVVAQLMISANLRASGLPRALHDFADTVAAEVKDRRAVEVERRGPRMQARTISLIMIGVLVYLFTATDYVAPYRRPELQLVLVGLLAIFAGLLVYISHLTRPVRAPRFLRDPAPPTKWWKPQSQPSANSPAGGRVNAYAATQSGGVRP